MYEDYLLLYVSNPATAIPYVISILNEFRSFYGYKLNLQNSECSLLTSPPQTSSSWICQLILAAQGSTIQESISLRPFQLLWLQISLPYLTRLNLTFRDGATSLWRWQAELTLWRWQFYPDFFTYSNPFRYSYQNPSFNRWTNLKHHLFGQENTQELVGTY